MILDCAFIIFWQFLNCEHSKISEILRITGEIGQKYFLCSVDKIAVSTLIWKKCATLRRIKQNKTIWKSIWSATFSFVRMHFYRKNKWVLNKMTMQFNKCQNMHQWLIFCFIFWTYTIESLINSIIKDLRVDLNLWKHILNCDVMWQRSLNVIVSTLNL